MGCWNPIHFHESIISLGKVLAMSPISPYAIKLKCVIGVLVGESDGCPVWTPFDEVDITGCMSECLQAAPISVHHADFIIIVGDGEGSGNLCSIWRPLRHIEEAAGWG